MNMGSQGHFKIYIIIEKNNKMQFTKIQRTPKSNIDEKRLNSQISGNIDEK